MVEHLGAVVVAAAAGHNVVVVSVEAEAAIPTEIKLKARLQEPLEPQHGKLRPLPQELLTAKSWLAKPSHGVPIADAGPQPMELPNTPTRKPRSRRPHRHRKRIVDW
jgi:hypothetical protein